MPLRNQSAKLHDMNISSVDFSIDGRCHASELFVAIFGGVVAMKKELKSR